ncbi:hypothetical protein [Halobaculum roseum]|uniref:Uncharacterized protein n=1 Tax=Halobaculum roseum TaxID=2175149 RepID=A0ABD5MRK6_9EURY|nr:hypothetical protein [Halobaculum roseum]QZY01243.1 hypothetical protein K6T36_07675 [Halobaculum roseum]
MATQSAAASTVQSLRERSVFALARTAVFSLSVLAFVFLWLLAFDFVLRGVFLAWVDPVLADTIHFVHDIALATWVWIWGAAMLVQLYRPAKRVAAMRIALLLTSIDFGLALALAAIEGAFDPSVLLFFAPVYLAAALHPARAELIPLGGLDGDAAKPVVLGIALLAVVPVLLYVSGQLTLRAVLTDEHRALGHYATMSYYGLSLVALAVLGAFGTRGRPSVYAAALLATMLAVSSVFNPTMSGLSPLWAALSVVWSLALVGSYERAVRNEASRRAARPVESADVSL